ncbi:MAG: hypothetical protein WC451_00155 [Patescibacteria group bacterium]
MDKNKTRKFLIVLIYTLFIAIISTYIWGIYFPERNIIGKITSSN